MLTCRPRFVLWTAVLRQVPLQLFLTLWAGLFFGGFAAFLGGVAAMTRRGGSPGEVATAMLTGPALFGSVAFVAVPLVTVGAKWLNYRNTRYRIDGRVIEVEEGFFTVQSKRLLIEDVREVSLRRGPLQRLSGVGSVYLASRVTGGGGAWRGTPLLGATSVTGSGVMLMDLPEWREVYEAMQRRLAA
jgi:hypothetical protein